MRQLYGDHEISAGDLAVVVQSDCISAVVFLSAGTELVSVPAGARYVAFSSTVDFCCRIGGATTWPNASVLDGSAGELNPSARDVREDTVIGLASSGPGVITLSFYK